MRTFVGFDGHYEIYDSGEILLRFADELGKLTGGIKKFANAKKINNDEDRNGVLHLLQVMRIYKTIIQKV
jgi:hypothetical protein